MYWCVLSQGKNCPKPIKEWYHVGLRDKILAILKKHNYEQPTPIQCQALPAIMSGRDVIGCAKTGSGKTLAFLLPMFRHVLDQPPLKDTEGPIALLIAPTRELAMQIYNECRKFSKVLDLRVCIYSVLFLNRLFIPLRVYDRWPLGWLSSYPLQNELDSLTCVLGGVYLWRCSHEGPDRRAEARCRNRCLHTGSHDRYACCELGPRHQPAARHVCCDGRGGSHVRHGL